MRQAEDTTNDDMPPLRFKSYESLRTSEIVQRQPSNKRHSSIGSGSTEKRIQFKDDVMTFVSPSINSPKKRLVEQASPLLVSSMKKSLSVISPTTNDA